MSDSPEFVITLAFNKNSEGRVTLAFTAGVAAVDKGVRTAIILIVDGVHVGLKGYAEDIDIGEPFLPVKDLLEVYLAHGGELMACGACWKFNHLAMGDKMPEVKVITSADIVDLLVAAKGSLQLN